MVAPAGLHSPAVLATSLAIAAATITAPTFTTTIPDTAPDLDQAIEAAWFDGEARERGIPTAQQLRDQLAQEAALSVTPAQIDAYVATHPRTLPEARRVRVLTTANRPRARAARRALQRGATWRATATRYRATIATRTTTTTATARLTRAIARAPEHTLTRYGTHVFKVLTITPPRPMPHKEQQAKAWERLASEAQEHALDALRAKWRARTVCAPTYEHHRNCGP